MQSPTRIASSADLPPGGHRSIHFHARDLVLFRTRHGRLRLIDAHCPHMGAHLGHGGRVDGSHMVCPFHGWKLDGRTGAVTEVPYSSRKPPRGVCVRTWPVWEQPDGAVVADLPGAAPKTSVEPPLPPFPRGWYALGFSRDVTPGTPHSLKWCGRSLTAHRETADGSVHLTVDDAGPPITLVEQQDTVFGWFDPDGASPTFALPAVDPAGWSGYAPHRFDDLATHPQETSENAVDLAHFTTVHGYDRVETVVPARADGPVLSATYAFTRHVLPGVARGALRAEFRARAFGLGYSFVETTVSPLDLRVRQLVLATPTVAGRLDLRLALSVAHKGPAPLRALAARLTRWGLMCMYIKDVSADLAIWQHKRYLDPPRLAQGDGPIGLYRRWTRQFYATSASRDAA